MCVCMREGSQLDVCSSENYWYVRPYGFDDWDFNCQMIDLAVVVSPLPLVLKINIGASGNSMDCVIGWEIVAMLQRLLLL
jgi:hypothetical protein